MGQKEGEGAKHCGCSGGDRIHIALGHLPPVTATGPRPAAIFESADLHRKSTQQSQCASVAMLSRETADCGHLRLLVVWGEKERAYT